MGWIGSRPRGAGTALVGSAESVAARIREYQAIGVEMIIASAYPHLEEAFNVADCFFRGSDYKVNCPSRSAAGISSSGAAGARASE
ncbi:hypothetical protein MPLSOD_140070 [Mesorhizobium sp. SOD10]|nr:hypothetical protein MPLSOD_140070 [Mesorhizobium sp. SOD10]